ncbi:MAG: NYN domain-containing protein [Calditrichaceae bacterium]|nr:NYN domain-containing protein [Calditrichaceae bacterium]MBN2708268.1 NYN domain-containing protein [Calditrichaceae bacterium]RQV95195.1 MAG: hypothetical protein EH224_08180 [Calditrichota bacterium]
MKNYIIDGYNVGFADNTIAGWISRGDIDRAIQMIINKIESIIPDNISKIILVLDGKHGYYNKNFNTYRIKVIFSRKPETADDIIRSVIRHEKKPEDWIVVSSDSEIKNTAQDMRAQSLNASEFLRSGKKKSKDLTKQEPEIKYDPEMNDLNYWLEQFRNKDSENE